MNRNLKSRSGLQPLHHPPHFKSPVTRPFKSPVTRPFKSPASTGKADAKPVENPEEHIDALKKKLATVRSQTEDLEQAGFQEEELQDHITKLHEYNEVKDAASLVLGRIATFEGVQTKDLYQRYGLELTD